MNCLGKLLLMRVPFPPATMIANSFCNKMNLKESKIRENLLPEGLRMDVRKSDKGEIYFDLDFLYLHHK